MERSGARCSLHRKSLGARRSRFVSCGLGATTEWLDPRVFLVNKYVFSTKIAQIRSTTAAGNLSRKKRWGDKNRCGSIKICSAPLRSTELRGAERSGARPLTKLCAPHHTLFLIFMFKFLKTQYKFVLVLSL